MMKTLDEWALDGFPHITTMNDGIRGGNRLHSHLPSECNYSLRVLEFMAITLLEESSRVLIILL